MVLNHNSGADAQEVNPITGQARWTLFNPKSRKFPRNWECFHPSMYETWDEMTFGDMSDLAHRNPYVYAELLKLTRWLIEEIGFDGFRYDLSKGMAQTPSQQFRNIVICAMASRRALWRCRVLGQCARH
jgi:alpha-amylase